MLLPKKVKHRKWHTDRKDFAGRAETRGTSVDFGSFGLKAETGARVKSNQIEAARKALSRSLTKVGKVWIRIFPDRPFTQKAAEVPMGAGKGSLDYFAQTINSGTIVFEMDGLPQKEAREALRLAAHKLPLRTKIITSITVA